MALTTAQETGFDNTALVVNALLYVPQRELVFEAPLVAAIERERAYIGVEVDMPTVGVLTDVQPEMTIELITDSPYGGGRQRVRGINAVDNIIHVGRFGVGYSNGRLNIPAGGSLRVYRDYRPFIKAPYISPTDTGEQYKDELLYPNDNEAQPPVACAGTDRLIITEDATASVSLDALSADFPSFAVRTGATLTGFQWDVRDGTITDGTASSAALTVSFPRGDRWISLTVTDSNGVTHTTHRVIAVAREADCIPAEIANWTVSAEGTELGVTFDTVNLPPHAGIGAKVLVVERENHGSATLAGYPERFSGWFGDEDSALEDAASGYSRITVALQDAAGFLKKNTLFAQSLNVVDELSGWYDMANANIDRMLHYILHWHTNILSLCDFRWTGHGTTYPFFALTTSTGTFWASIAKLAGGIAHKFTCDTRSRLRFVPDPHITPTTEQADTYGLPTQRPEGVVTTFRRGRYSTFGNPVTRDPSAYWYHAGGIVASNDPNNLAAVACVAPSNAPSGGDNGASRNDLLVTGIDELCVWAANQYAAEYGATIGTLSLNVTSPAHLIEPAEGLFVAVELPAYHAARYHLPPDTGNRWTVESITYAFDGTGKTAEYILRKELPAAQPAKPTPQYEDGDLWQGWNSFDTSINPFTGTVTQGYSNMAPTIGEIAGLLNRTTIVSRVTTDGTIGIKPDGTIDTGDGSGSGTIGAGTDAEQAARNGGHYGIARQVSEFFASAQTIFNQLSGSPDARARFKQFVEVTLVNPDPLAVEAWAAYLYDGTPDTTLPSLGYTDRGLLTGDLFCASSYTQGMSNYITLRRDPAVWPRWFNAVAVFSTEQYNEWYSRGTSTPVNFYSGYICYTYPVEILRLNTALINAETVITGNAKNWEARFTFNGPPATLIYIEASGQAVEGTVRRDAFYTYDSVTNQYTYSPLALQCTRTGGGGPVNIVFNTPPAYQESGKYAVTGVLPIPSFTAPGTYSATRYALSDTRGDGAATGNFEVKFTDLGKT